VSLAVREGLLTALLGVVLASPAALGAPQPPPTEAPGPPAAETPPEEPEILGAPSAFGVEDSAEAQIAVPAGTALLDVPDPRAAALAVIDAASELPLLERRGPWARVRYGALKGWVLLAGDGAVAGGAPEGPLPARAADPDLLASALEALPGDPAPAELGSYTLYTDLEDTETLRLLDGVASALPAIYRQRFGLDPGVGTGEVVVVYSRQADYRAFAEGSAALAGLEEGGHAGFGLAALATEGLEDWQAVALLVHELTHLMNARALGPRTPPWLEEGLADDLAYSRLERSGRLSPGTLGGVEAVRRRRVKRSGGGDEIEVTVSVEGAYAALGRLVARLGQEDGVPPLEALAGLSWHRLSDPRRRELYYAESAFFIRYLLDGGDARLARGFREYLDGIAAGGDGEPGDLRRALGTGWDALDAGFGRWLRALSLRAGD
jgi:hypothetical protein